jgi:hypothetical protein
MMTAILDESISEEEHGSLVSLIRSLVKGRIQVADELSIVSQAESSLRTRHSKTAFHWES